MKRAISYTRISTFDQNPKTQALDLRRLAEQRGFEIVHEYTDRISGAVLRCLLNKDSSGSASTARCYLILPPCKDRVHAGNGLAKFLTQAALGGLFILCQCLLSNRRS
jgi:hypothetical protein